MVMVVPIEDRRRLAFERIQDALDYGLILATKQGCTRCVASYVRLQIDGSLDYAALMKQIAVSVNSLALHLGKLEESQYIACEKACIGQPPKSIYHITSVGRKALANYLGAMQSIIDSVKNAKAK
jgi:DNA-binding HxlR family transcriptional regulator